MKSAYSGFGRVLSSCLLISISLSTGMAARAQSGNLLVADFEGGKVETVAGLALPVLADEQFGGNSGAELSVVHPGAQGSGHALRITFDMKDGFATPFTSVWTLLGERGLATDLSAYKGVRFYARGVSGSFNASINRFVEYRSSRHVVPIEVKPEWTLVEVSFEQFARTAPAGRPAPSPGNVAPFSATEVTSIGLGLAPQLRGQFVLEIDQVEVYK